jgi:hypothetical protein
MISSRQLYATAALLINTVFAQDAPRIAHMDLYEPNKLGKLQYCKKGYDCIDLGVDLQHHEYRCAVPWKQGDDCRKTGIACDVGFACHVYGGHCYGGGLPVTKRGESYSNHPHFKDPCQRGFFCMGSCGAYIN